MPRIYPLDRLQHRILSASLYHTLEQRMEELVWKLMFILRNDLYSDLATLQNLWKVSCAHYMRFKEFEFRSPELYQRLFPMQVRPITDACGDIVDCVDDDYEPGLQLSEHGYIYDGRQIVPVKGTTYTLPNGVLLHM